MEVNYSVKDTVNILDYNIWSCGEYSNNPTGFETSHNGITCEVTQSNHSTIGNKCLHIKNPNTSSFESLYIGKTDQTVFPSNTGYQVTFDLYYPSTNQQTLCVRFWEYNYSSQVNTYIRGQDNIQHISISIMPNVQTYFWLQLFNNGSIGEYWIDNIQAIKVQ